MNLKPNDSFVLHNSEVLSIRPLWLVSNRDNLQWDCSGCCAIYAIIQLMNYQTMQVNHSQVLPLTSPGEYQRRVSLFTPLHVRI